MRSIERRFKRIKKQNPYWSSPTWFAMTVWGQGYGHQTIHRWFYKLVSRDDYPRSERKNMLMNYMRLNEQIEDYKKSNATALTRDSKPDNEIKVDKRLIKTSEDQKTPETCRPQGTLFDRL